MIRWIAPEIARAQVRNSLRGKIFKLIKIWPLVYVRSKVCAVFAHKPNHI